MHLPSSGQLFPLPPLQYPHGPLRHHPHLSPPWPDCWLGCTAPRGWTLFPWCRSGSTGRSGQLTSARLLSITRHGQNNRKIIFKTVHVHLLYTCSGICCTCLQRQSPLAFWKIKKVENTIFSSHCRLWFSTWRWKGIVVTSSFCFSCWSTSAFVFFQVLMWTQFCWYDYSDCSPS